MNYENIPAQLKATLNWVGFRIWCDTKDNKLKKIPVDIKATITSKSWKDLPAKSDNPATWCDFETAVKWVQSKNSNEANPYHLGFAFNGKKFVGIDLDKCIGENGELSEFAKNILAEIPSYAELSPSGKGDTVFVFSICRRIKLHSANYRRI